MVSRKRCAGLFALCLLAAAGIAPPAAATPIVLDRAVVRFTAPETGGVRSPRFVLERVQVGRNPRGVTFSPDGRFAYVANALSDTVTVLDATSFDVTAEILLGGPEEITEVRRGARLFHSAGITYAQQFSCRSCHPDGHTNGLTFDIEADGLGLCVVTGTQRRHQTDYLDVFREVAGGAIGDVLGANVYWNGSVPWWRDRQPDYFFSW